MTSAHIQPHTSIPTAPYNATGFAFPTHYQLPYTLQWNVAVEQAVGKSESRSTTYVGCHAAMLLEVNLINISAVNPNFPRDIEFFPSGTAHYDALQVQFQRRFTHVLTALASYTLSHSLDYGSQDNTQPYIRVNSTFDVPQNFTSAFSYDLPTFTENRVSPPVLRHCL